MGKAPVTDARECPPSCAAHKIEKNCAGDIADKLLKDFKQSTAHK